MSKIILPLAICSLVLFSACQPAAPSGATTGSSSSSAEAMMDSGARHGGDMAWQVVAEWSPQLKWSEPIAGTNQDLIPIDDQRNIPAGAIQARTSFTSVTAGQYGEYFIDKRAELSTAMIEKGWQEHAALAADGVGTQWGYIHADEDGTRFVIIAATCEEFLGAKANEPPPCSAYEASVTITDMLVAGDDL